MAAQGLGRRHLLVPPERRPRRPEARDKKNSRGPKWVSIGPAGADYEQNGSFTGHVGDSGRARTILPHPTNPDIVYVLTSGGGLWRTNNWQSSETTWRC